MATAYLDRVQARSIPEKVEYCGWFGYDSRGDLLATPAKRGGSGNFDLDEPPAGFKAVTSDRSFRACPVFLPAEEYGIAGLEAREAADSGGF